MFRGRNLMPIAALILTAGLIALSGCDVRVLYGPPGGTATVKDDTLLAVVEPTGTETYRPGDIIPIRWTGTIDSPDVAIEMYRYGQFDLTIAGQVANTGSYDWIIPANFDTTSEAPDHYQISIRARDPDHEPGELMVQAFSEPFTIAAAATGGLSDVTVGQRIVTITVTDNGQEIDGDTIDIILNGSTVIAGHVLLAPPGTDLELILQAGSNVLEIVAVNEGSISPNTAELAISHVTEGESVQEWRLLAGERGSLTITAP